MTQYKNGMAFFPTVHHLNARVRAERSKSGIDVQSIAGLMGYLKMCPVPLKDLKHVFCIMCVV